MTVTEIATLKLLSPHTWTSPSTRTFFQALALHQAEWSGYPLRFFEDRADSQIIYLITGWESVPAHYEWIASVRNQELLKLAEGLLEVVGLQHVQLDADSVADAQYVRWVEWEPVGADGRENEGTGVGVVLEKDGRVLCGLAGYARDDGGVEGEDGKETRYMRKLDLERS